jgi:type I restriction enzyme S subunit
MKFENFTSILEDITSHYYKIKKEDYNPSGLYPIIDQGQNFIGGYTDDENLIAKEKLPVIIFGDHTKILKYIDFPFAIGADGVKVLSLKNPSFNTKYYYFFLKTLKLTDAGYSRHYKFLKESNLPLPENVEDQNQIANLLSQCEDIIKHRNESVKFLDEFLKSTFLEMFGDPMKNEMNWETVKFKQLAKIDRVQVTPDEFTKEDFYVGLEDIEKETGNIIKTSLENAEELKSSKFRFTTDHILYAKLRPYLNKVALPDKGGICSTDIFPITPIKDFSLRFFICYLMRSSYFVTEMTNKSVGANLPRANPESIENLKVYKPPIVLQEKFSLVVERANLLKEDYKESLQELENLYGSLSQKAFKGALKFKSTKQPFIGDPFEGVEIPEGKLPSIDDLDKTKWIDITEPPKEKDSKVESNTVKKDPYETLFPLIGKVEGRSGDLKDIELLISKHFKDGYFVFEDLKRVFIEMGFPYDFELLKNFVFELLRKGKIQQVFADASFKSKFTDQHPDFKKVNELKEQMYLQRTTVF